MLAVTPGSLPARDAEIKVSGHCASHWVPGPVEATDSMGPDLKSRYSFLRPQLVEFSSIFREATDICPQMSPQVNQDSNHNSKDRIVLLFSFFFFLKGVRAWKIQRTNETKCQKKYKKI